MKIKSIQSNLKLILLTLLCAFALNFSAFADNKVVTSSLTESGTSYNDSDPTQAALTVTGDGVTYSGTDITLSGNNNGYFYDGSGNGAYINNASLSLTGGSITTSGSGGHGISFAEFASNGGLTLNNVIIKTEGYEAWGVLADYLKLPVTMNGGSITTSGNAAIGIFANVVNGSTVSNVTIETTGAGSHGMEAMGELALTNNDIRVTGSGAYGIYSESNVTVDLDGNTLSGTGVDGGSIYLMNGFMTVTGSNGSLITGDVVTNRYGNGTIDITLTDAGTKLHGDFNQDGGVINLTLGAGALLEGSGELDSLTLENGAVIGYTGLITVTDSITIDGTVTIDLSNLTETGEYEIIDWSTTLYRDVEGANYNFTGAEGDFTTQGAKLVFNATAVPEPTTYLLLGAGLGALLLAARYRRQARTDA